MSKNGTQNGRDPQTGRFKKGWKGGPGRPPNRSEYDRLRSEILNAKSEDGKPRITKVISSMFDRAEDGNEKAARLLLEYGFGKPKPHDDELDAMKHQTWRYDFLQRGGVSQNGTSN